MAFNQLSFAGQPAPTRVLTMSQNPGQVPQLTSNGTQIVLPVNPGQRCLIPAGQFIAGAGPYCDLQFWDNGSQRWIDYSIFDSSPTPISSDGTNYSFSNSTGCPIGAVITAAGTANALPVSMYTPTGVWVGGTFTAQASPAITVTPSAGGATFNTFIGGSVSNTTTAFITNGGSGYTFAPKLVVVAPAAQGSQPYIPATMQCTISGGVINAITMTNQGAGYVSAPTIMVLNQPGDLTGSGAIITPVMTGAGQITAVITNTFGSAVTAVPTLAFAGSSLPAGAAATALMNFSIAAGGTATAGSGYTTGYKLVELNSISTAVAIYNNPSIEKGITNPVSPIIYGTGTTVVAITAAQIVFGGYGLQIAPNLAAIGVGTLGGIATTAVGGSSDTCNLYPM